MFRRIESLAFSITFYLKFTYFSALFNLINSSAVALKVFWLERSTTWRDQFWEAIWMVSIKLFHSTQNLSSVLTKYNEAGDGFRIQFCSFPWKTLLLIFVKIYSHRFFIFLFLITIFLQKLLIHIIFTYFET